MSYNNKKIDMCNILNQHFNEMSETILNNISNDNTIIIDNINSESESNTSSDIVINPIQNNKIKTSNKKKIIKKNNKNTKKKNNNIQKNESNSDLEYHIEDETDNFIKVDNSSIINNKYIISNLFDLINSKLILYFNNILDDEQMDFLNEIEMQTNILICLGTHVIQSQLEDNDIINAMIISHFNKDIINEIHEFITKILIMQNYLLSYSSGNDIESYFKLLIDGKNILLQINYCDANDYINNINSFTIEAIYANKIGKDINISNKCKKYNLFDIFEHINNRELHLMYSDESFNNESRSNKIKAINDMIRIYNIYEKKGFKIYNKNIILPIITSIGLHRGNECPICKDYFYAKLCVLLSCGHVIHEECAIKDMQLNDLDIYCCPLCKNMNQDDNDISIIKLPKKIYFENFMKALKS